MSRKFKIVLKEIKIFENGVFEDEKEGSNFFEAIWIKPKIGISSVRSVLELPLIDDKEYFSTKLAEETNKIESLNLFDLEKFELKKQLELEMFKTQLLFKQEIEDESYLEFNLSTVQKPDKALNFLSKILGVTVKTAFGTIPGLGSVVADTGSALIESAFKGIESQNDKLTSIGRGVLKIDEKIIEKIPGNEIEIPLNVPKLVNIKSVKHWIINDENGRYKFVDRVSEPIVLNKGKRNGTIKIVISEIL